MCLKKSLNVFFAVDKSFLTHFTVTITSLLENNKDITITVYIIHDMTNSFEIEKIISFLTQKYTVSVKSIFVDNSIFNNFQVVHYISKATYFRFLLADILPKNISSGLYLDCDIIITGSLMGILNSNFIDKSKGECGLLAVSDKGEIVEIERLKNKLSVETDMYFNAGVMFINLNKWREENVANKLIEIADKYKDLLTWSDQDVLNIYFKNKCGRLDSTYNTFTNKVLAKTPIIIHFSGSSKPWHYLNNHPYKTQYWKYLNLTPFKNEKFEKVTFKKILKKYLVH